MEWIVFSLFIIIALAFDLGIFNKKAHHIRFKEAILLTSFWIILSIFFNIGIYRFQGYHKAIEYFTGYLVEYSLSMDNIFVFVLIFKYFKVPSEHQHKVLFYGILGAILMRALFIFTGIGLIQKFHWIIYLFAIILIISSIKMFFGKEKEISPEKNIILKIFRKFIPLTKEYQGDHFFIYQNKILYATPLFIVLIIIESTDIIFAADSIPAIFGITLDPFIVYTSNIFAILGLRSLYFTIREVIQLFHYLHYGLSLILGFIGIKMIISSFYKIPTLSALAIIAIILTISIIASIAFPKKVQKNHPAIED